MGIYTATLSAQNTSVFICDIQRPSGLESWFANAMASGTFGSGTVSFQISVDNGTTKTTLMQDGTASAASLTAAGALNLRSSSAGSLTPVVKLYATIGAATTPSVLVTVIDNRG